MNERSGFLPDWADSIRFRLTAIYSLVLFGIGVIVVGSIYLGLAARLNQETISRDYTTLEPVPGGVIVREGTQVVTISSFEQQVNARALDLLRAYSFLALAMLFLISLGVGWIISGRVLAPIDRITAVARDIQATDLSRRISLQGPADELKDLADTFDGMLARLDQAFEGQRRFIQDASHELRNPLAVIRTNIDVALSDPEADADDLRHTAEVVQRTVERMSVLVDDLLAYAREGSLDRQMARVDVAEVVADSAAEFIAPTTARHLRLLTDTRPGLWVVADRVALRQALTNLLANATRLAPVGSNITVTAGAVSSWVWLSVADDGPGIAEEDRDLVFQRFWRGGGGERREKGRSGLGLTIVRQISASHRGEVRLAPNDHGGSTFTLWLPAAD